MTAKSLARLWKESGAASSDLFYFCLFLIFGLAMMWLFFEVDDELKLGRGALAILSLLLVLVISISRTIEMHQKLKTQQALSFNQ